MKTRTTPWPPGTSARRPSGRRKTRTPSGKPSPTAPSRPSPPTTAPSPSPRRTPAGATSPRSPAACRRGDRGILLYSEGVAKGRISAPQMCALLSETPAKLYGAFPKKGILAPGSDADIVVLDPDAQGCITAADQAANVDYSPYEGFITRARSTRSISAAISPWTRARSSAPPGASTS